MLKKRFAVVPQAGAGQIFDQLLADAIKRFQISNSLSSDGIVGPGTRAALAGDAADKNSEKITAVIANMEEWRWMPRSLGATHFLVNIPSFSIVLTDKNQTVFEERVVVGAPSTQTPIFSKNMTAIVLRPEWNLPDSIKLTALLSGRSIEGQGYVVKRNGHTVDSSRVNWTKANLSEYTIYQPSGDDNALGLVKLLFPNKHSVYLHDTPSKSLFDESVRLFSHGCMRVRNPRSSLGTSSTSIAEMRRRSSMGLSARGRMDMSSCSTRPSPCMLAISLSGWMPMARPSISGTTTAVGSCMTLALRVSRIKSYVGSDHLAAVDASLLRQSIIGSKSRSETAARCSHRPFLPLQCRRPLLSEYHRYRLRRYRGNNSFFNFFNW